MADTDHIPDAGNMVPAPTPPPVETSDDAVLAAIGILFRQFSIALPTLIAALGFLSRHDLAGLYAWAQTDAVKPVLFGLWAAVAAVWGFRKSIRQKLALIRVSRSHRVPDEVARIVPSRLARAWAVLRGRA